ncbi:MAG: cation:dicarboxylase symporter family transporter [Eggerthellaceae bacterium]|nr:cation:dicarboxylase symporter family transporter [Eggerthellaceae bacterium]
MQFQVREEDFEAAFSFVEELLAREDISDKVASEALIVFEALFQKLLDSELDEGATLDISGRKRLGDLSLSVGFEGKAFVPYLDGEDSVESKILRAHDDKLDCSYRAGYNLISISVSRSYQKTLSTCLIASLCAVIVYSILYFTVGSQGHRELFEGYVLPLEKMYANAVLMIGAPMTFFSLLKNLTDTYVVSQRNSGVRGLQISTLATSVVAILLAFVTISILSIPFSGLAGTDSVYGGSSIDRSFEDIVVSLVPPSIFEPFEALSPVPLMVVALLVTYALCSTGKYFDALRQAMEACYALFSRMLRVVIAALPVFCFLALTDALLDSGFWALPFIAGYFVVFNMSLLVLFASYAVRLRARGIPVVPFVQKLIPLIRENLKIGSAIDAVPFNVRYCARTYGMNRERLEQNMPVLAQINLDGNCFLIMLIALAFVFMTGTNVSWLNLAGIATLVLFLSFGAPNQPGSILIATLIITSYLHSYEMMCVAIYAEALFGSSLNIANVIGDVVSVAIGEQAYTKE